MRRVPLLGLLALLALPASAAAQDAVGHDWEMPSMGLTGAPEAARATPWMRGGADVAPMARPAPVGEGQLAEALRRAVDCADDGRLGTATAMLERLIDEHPDSETHPAALLTLAVVAHATGDHARAADAYARFVERFPADERAPDAMRRAIALDLALGRLEEATENVERFGRNYGRRRPDEAARLASALGDALERRGDTRALLAHDRDWLRRWGGRAPVGLRIGVRARLARALEARGDDDGALEARRRVVALWDGPDSVELRDDPQASAHVSADVARALLAVGDAERAAAESQPFPTLRGRHIGADKVGRWARDHLMPWLEARMDGLTRAARAYDRVGEVGATVHHVAAAVSVGEMWLELAASFDRAPTPRELRADPQLLQVYRSALDDQTRPLRGRAIEALEHAVGLAARHHLFGPETRRAIATLRVADPARVGGDELLGWEPAAARGGVLPRSVLQAPPDGTGCRPARP